MKKMSFEEVFRLTVEADVDATIAPPPILCYNSRRFAKQSAVPNEMRDEPDGSHSRRLAKQSAVPNEMRDEPDGNVAEDAGADREDSMAEEIRADQRTVEYRKRNLERHLMRIRDEVMGRNESFRPFVEGKNGKLSAQKINAFIKELLNSCTEAKAFSKGKRELLENFFYCVILGPSDKSIVQRRALAMDYRHTDSFGELINASLDALFQEKDRQRFVRDEEYERLYIEMGSGFSFLLNYVYEDLTGESSRDFYTPKDLAIAADEYACQLDLDSADVLRSWKESATEEGEEVAQSENDQIIPCEADENGAARKIKLSDTEELSDTVELSDTEGLSDTVELSDAEELIDFPEPDWEALQREEELELDVCMKSWKAYTEQLPAKHHLPQSYATVRRLVYEEDCSDLAKVTEEMVDGFLIRHGLSPMCFQRGYGLIDTRLSKCTDEIRQSVERSRKHR